MITRYGLDNFFDANHLNQSKSITAQVGKNQVDQNVMRDYNKKVMPDSKVEHHHELLNLIDQTTFGLRSP